MRSHFRAVHLEDTIIIEEEGEFEQCIKCGFFGKIVTKRNIGIQKHVTITQLGGNLILKNLQK